MIRPCTDVDTAVIHAIINEAAQVYHNVIPPDCWHDPYMSRGELMNEIAAGVNFWGWDEAGALLGVMGIQSVKHATLIRHAYVLPAQQNRGIGGALLKALVRHASGPVLVGTWAAAEWAICFYQRNGFRLVTTEHKDRLLNQYWTISPRQRETSVVLALAARPATSSN
jgi:GNAT superfamily N-acetyltransferase